jgi:hypothetical protein
VLLHPWCNIKDVRQISDIFLGLNFSRQMIRRSFFIARSIKEIEFSYNMFNYMNYRYISLQALKYEIVDILHFTFLFSLFVFVSAASHYFRIWTGQVPALF